MTKELDKTTLTRLAWLTELRRQGHRQCIGPFHWETGNVCAIVLLHEMVERQDGSRSLHSPRKVAADCTGLSEAQIDEIIAMNDGRTRDGRKVRRRTFAEIADVVEAWFK